MKITPTRVRLLTAVSALAMAGSLAAAMAHGALAATAAPGSAGRPTIATSGNIANSVSGLCLGAHDGYTNTYTVIWNCNGHPDQTWHRGAVSPRNDLFYQLVNNNGMCLGTQGGKVSNGTPVMAWACQGSGATNQYWFYDCRWLGQDGDGCVLSNLNAPPDGFGLGGKVAGVSGGSRANGARVVIWDNTLGPDFHGDQAWYTGIW